MYLVFYNNVIDANGRFCIVCGTKSTAEEFISVRDDPSKYIIKEEFIL